MNPITAFFIGYAACGISACFVFAIFLRRREPKPTNLTTHLDHDLKPEERG